MFVNSSHLHCALFADIECAKSYAKMAESAKTLASQQVRSCFATDLTCTVQFHYLWALTVLFVLGIHAFP